MIILKLDSEINKLKEVNRIGASVLHKLKKEALPGITTRYLDTIAYELITLHKASPAFLNYRGFPNSICTSINEEIVHGIPSNRQLKDGDILSIDIGIEMDGYFSDMAITMPIGNITDNAKRLINVTELCLYKAIEKCLPGNRLHDIAYAIHKTAHQYEYDVVQEYCGHGIGKTVHEEPQVLNYITNSYGAVLMPGMVIAIEPMITQFKSNNYLRNDGWTVSTIDRGLSAHFEHSIAICEDGPMVLSHL